MQHILPTDTVNKALAYLSSRPYSEVIALIDEIKAVAVLHEAENPSTADPVATPAAE